MKAVGVLLGLFWANAAALAQQVPADLPGLRYDAQFFPGTDYDPAVPTPRSVLGFDLGERAASPAQIEQALKAWAEASPRAELVEYARSHEGRALYYMILTSPANHVRLEEIKAGLARLADPRGLSEAEATRLIESLPGTAWLAYSIHGDETSGADGALALTYHLVAGRDEEVTGLLQDLVVLVDPMMNPDGRQRFLQQIAEHRGTNANVDDQSLLHAGYWPWGRTNHYGFDLNRDWILGVNPETRGRIREAAAWHPLLFVDGHEMGSQDTYLFSPARDPRNPNVPASRGKWGKLFARDQSEAFDKNDWVYYTGEWNEGWYPGYSDSWGEFRGAVGILYEQAGFAEDGVRRPEGTIHTYREAVHHQVVSSLANLRTLRSHVHDIRRDVWTERRSAVSRNGVYAQRTFAILSTLNRSRTRRFAELMRLQGFEIYQATAEVTVSGTDQLGRAFRGRRLPAGTLLIPNRQPEAHLLATMLEFDAHMTPEYLQRERKEILKSGSSSVYDITAWNLTMMYGLQGLTLSSDLPPGATPYEVPAEEAVPAEALPGAAGDVVAWAIDGADDASVAVAARLLERGVQVRVADRSFESGDRSFSRGSVVIRPIDNRLFEGDLAATILETANEAGLETAGLLTGLGEGDLPDLGGSHFVRLEKPRVALLSRGGVSVYDFGSIWYTLDHRLGLRHSHLTQQSFGSSDLRRYNVIVLPDRWSGQLPEASLAALTSWVEAGGTLIAIGTSAGQLSAPESKISEVRLLPDVLEDLDAYEAQILREWMAEQAKTPEAASVWSHTVAGAARFPWSPGTDLERADKEELERRDRWQRMFMPQGVVLAARTNSEHWLTIGTGDVLPVLYNSPLVFMSGSGVETPVRAGIFEDGSGSEAVRVGWSLMPPGKRLRLRMSGLLWPEAAQRLSNAALVTRERKGRGQVILFAVTPTFRGTALGTERLLTNAIVYGPGLGAQPPIKP